MKKLFISALFVLFISSVVLAANVEVKLDSSNGTSGLLIRNSLLNTVAAFDSYGNLTAAKGLFQVSEGNQQFVIYNNPGDFNAMNYAGDRNEMLFGEYGAGSFRVGIRTTEAYATLQVHNPDDTTTKWAILAMQPKLANNNYTQILLGKHTSTNNAATISFVPNATAARSSLRLGLYNSSDTLSLNGNGYVGIGTGESNAPLEIKGAQSWMDLTTSNNTNGSVLQLINLKPGLGPTDFLGAINWGAGYSAGIGQIGYLNGGAMTFTTGGRNMMNIDTVGVGIGTYPSTASLEVHSNQGNNAIMGLYGPSTGGHLQNLGQLGEADRGVYAQGEPYGLYAYGYTYGVYGYASNGYGVYGHGSTYGVYAEGASIAAVYASGKLVGTGGVQFTGIGSGTGTTLIVDGSGNVLKSTSSRRYKHDIKEYDSDISKLGKLTPVKFKWNPNTGSPNQEDFGLIAEDVYKIFPELVGLDKAGRPDSVKYDKLSVILLKGYQEKVKEIDALKEKNENLESRLKALEEKIGARGK